MINEFNFVSSNVNEEDKDLFFGPLEGEEFIVLEPTDKWCHIMFKIGQFNSVGQARKNGWDKEIESGWIDQVIGKKKIRVCILNLKDQ